MKSESEAEYDKLYNEKRLKWSQAFCDYYQKNIEPKLCKYAKWHISSVVEFDDESGITNNMSEGFNWLMKDLHDWHEVPLDILIMSLMFLQQYLLKEIARSSTAAIGKYTVRNEFKDDMLDRLQDVLNINVIHPKDIVKSIKSMNLEYDDEPMEFSTNSTVVRANMIVQSDGISMSARLKTFLVHSGTKTYSVNLYPREFCSCMSGTTCHHVLAVKLGLGMEVSIDPKSQKINLVTLRKATRKGRQKPGRKRPRVGDLDIEVIEAPDSKKAKNDKNQTPQSAPTVTPMIWADNNSFQTRLTTNDKDLIENDDGWLGDAIIDRSMEMLKSQFPSIGGLISCLEATNFSKPTRPKNEFVQVINTQPWSAKKHLPAGNHWVTIATKGCNNLPSDVQSVALYDSLKLPPTPSVKKAASMMLKINGKRQMHLVTMNCDSQLNSSDCGIYAVANAVTLCLGDSPIHVRYFDGMSMRDHLSGQHLCMISTKCCTKRSMVSDWMTHDTPM